MPKVDPSNLCLRVRVGEIKTPDSGSSPEVQNALRGFHRCHVDFLFSD